MHTFGNPYGRPHTHSRHMSSATDWESRLGDAYRAGMVTTSMGLEECASKLLEALCRNVVSGTVLVVWHKTGPSRGLLAVGPTPVDVNTVLAHLKRLAPRVKACALDANGEVISVSDGSDPHRVIEKCTFVLAWCPESP